MGDGSQRGAETQPEPPRFGEGLFKEVFGEDAGQKDKAQPRFGDALAQASPFGAAESPAGGNRAEDPNAGQNNGAQGKPPWRATWGQVPRQTQDQLRQNDQQVRRQNAEDPNQNGGADKPPWRGTWGGDVDRNVNGSGNGQQGDGRQNPPVWKPKPIDVDRYGGRGNPVVTPDEVRQAQRDKQIDDLLDRALGRPVAAGDFFLNSTFGGLSALGVGEYMHSKGQLSWANGAQRGYSDFMKGLETGTGAQLNGVRATVNAELTAMQEALRGGHGTLEQALKAGGVNAEQQAALTALQNKANFLNSNSALDAAALRQARAGGIAFTEAELATLGAAQQGSARAASLEAVIARSNSMKYRMGRNFATGFAVAAGAQILDDKLAQAFHGKNHGLTSFHATSALLPMAFAIPQTWKGRIGYSLGAVAAGRLVDYGVQTMLPTDTAREYSHIFKPNNVEAIATGAAMFLPVGKYGKLGRVGWLAGAYTLGRGYNLLFGEKPARDIRQEARVEWQEEQSERTGSSMQETIDRYKELGLSGPAGKMAVQREFETWMGDGEDSAKSQDSVTSARGKVILAAALAETKFELGTEWLNQSEATYVFKGHGIDLGGQSLRHLEFAKIRLNTARQQTEHFAANDLAAQNTKVSRDELKGLAEVEKRVDATIAKIYGEHNIDAVYREAQGHVGSDTKLLGKLRDDMIRRIVANRSQNAFPQYTAKLARDVALVELAWAKVKIDHKNADAEYMLYGGAPDRQQRGFSGALDALKIAIELDPNNPDNKHLLKIAKELVGDLPNAVWENQNHWFKNPFGTKH